MYVYMYVFVCMYMCMPVRVCAAMTETNKKKTPLIFQHPHNKFWGGYSCSHISSHTHAYKYTIFSSCIVFHNFEGFSSFSFLGKQFQFSWHKNGWRMWCGSIFLLFYTYIQACMYIIYERLIHY